MDTETRQPYHEFGHVLQQARERKRLTLEAFAAAASIPLEHLRDAEEGRRLHRLDELQRIATACDVPLDDLLSEVLRRTPPNEIQRLEGWDLGPVPRPR